MKWRGLTGATRYLKEWATSEDTQVGLIMGQHFGDSNEIIHLARTPEDVHADTPDSGLSSDKEESSNEDNNEKYNSILYMSDSWIADHAKHVTRMLPGGMFVLGVFVISSEDVFSNNASLAKIKNILSHVNRTLSYNKFMFGVPPHNERLLIHFSIKGERLTCKSFDIEKLSTQPKSIQLQLRPNFDHWQQLDCYHEFDEVYPIITKNAGISVREQFQNILIGAHETVDASIIFMNGKLVNENDLLETLQKKNKNSSEENAPRPIQVSIFSPGATKLPNTVEYIECEGTTHFSGIVGSKVFLSTKATVKDAIVTIKQDVIRSLASRFTMHCDALIHDDLLPEEKVCFNEPPRRVLIKLPQFDGNLFFCDYLFPGESPVEALVSVKEMLDADITEDDVICNVETPADTSEFDRFEKNPNMEEVSIAPESARQVIYFVSIVFAFIALFMAFFIQYIL